MNLENFEKSKKLNTSEESISLEKKTAESKKEINLAEFKEQTIQATENKTEELIIQGQNQIDKIEEKSGLSLPNLVSIREEFGPFNKLKEIQGQSGAFVNEIKNKLADIGRPTKNLEEKNFPFPPIGEGEIFAPKIELQKIHQAPKEEQPERLREFKEKLTYQKKGLALIQEKIIQKIKENPDAPLGQLYEWVRDLGPKYGLTNEQKEISRKLLQTYVDKHAKVRSIREQYSDDKELFKALFGQEPKGDIKVVESPVTLYFRCQDPLDYTYLHSHSFQKSKDVTNEELKAAERSAGVTLGSCLVPGLERAITAENSFFVLSDYDSEQVFKHEEQHTIKQLFKDKLRESELLCQERELWAKFYQAIQNNDERLATLKSYLRVRRQIISDEKAKDEILAYLKEKRMTMTKIAEYLTIPKEKGGYYDYLISDKQRFISWFAENYSDEFKKFKSTIEKAVEEVYGEEYQNLIRKSVMALQSLRETGYSKEAIIALLIQEPLSGWEKVVKRLIHRVIGID
ncbi:hypothetical protein COZ81_02360 [Candidatus Jorgensenbacteria bacterium CG_4_8_14_3_um_filter_38_10]|nr:MAG: hypothetical protein COZ81_02360 [Candidatus Jorgensenbacteria bacterium CG_4_8_14_3_um_filter_38_10]